MDATDFWDGYGHCAELAFKENRDYVEKDDKCIAVRVVDGASITFQAKKGKSILGTKQRSTAIGYKELTSMAKEILKIGEIKYW